MKNANAMPMIDPARLAQLPSLTLKKGNHASPEDGMCVLEAAAWLAGEPHSDSPDCVCPVLGAFVRPFHDRMASDEERTRWLGPLAVALVGTRAGLEGMRARAFRMVDWLFREALPLFYRAMGREEEAARCEALNAVVGRESALLAKKMGERMKAEAQGCRATATYAAIAATYAAIAATYAAIAATYAAIAATYAAIAAAYAAIADAAAVALAVNVADARCVRFMGFAELKAYREALNASAVAMLRELCEE
jgi:hypothetical protein